MSDRFRISRRRVMQLGIAAPLIALEARGATSAEVEAAAHKLAKIPIPDDKLKKIREDAKKYCKDNNCDGFCEENYGKIGGGLWLYFTTALDKKGATVPDADSAELTALLNAAYAAKSQGVSEKSGELIAKRSKDWGDTWEHVTNYCAFRCGVHAADIAKHDGRTEIKDTDYTAAFEITATEVKSWGPSKMGGGC